MEEGRQSFLALYSAERVKKEIRGICESYSHPWDIVAELLQNSVDAIKKWNKENASRQTRRHFIDIKIDKQAKGIKITDSGIGIDLNHLPKLLAPNVTDKENDKDLVGEKGVGLKFAIFSSNKFTLKTTSKIGSYACEVNNARDWLNNTSEDLIDVENEAPEKKDYKPLETYTEIEVNGLGDTAEQIFQYDLNELIYILRTRTFIGYTGKIFKNEDLDIAVNVEFTDEVGKTTKSKVDFGYWLPSNFFDKNKLADVDQYETEAVRLNDAQRAKKLSGKCLFSKKEITYGGRKFWYYAFFVPKREFWKQMASEAKLNREVGGESLIGNGIFASTRGMPTGIEIVPPRGWAMGFWAQLFILIESDDFKFDIGRKTIPNREKIILQNIAKEQFGRFTGLWGLVSTTPPAPVTPIREMQKQERIRILETLPNLGLMQIPYQKEPDYQEAAVVAIFHELLGANLIRGYYGYKSGYKESYDFWGKYKINKEALGKNIQTELKERKDVDLPFVIEFKYDASYIIDDVEHNKKHFEDIDLIVCWDIENGAFAEKHISVEPVAEEDIFWHGSNYKLVWPGTYNLGNNSEKAVLSLRQFIDTCRRANQGK